ncbi:thiamine pyrophosphate-binding protein [Achromobacter sp. GG226]|uniref:thiamine pyrophosphate-binding protein n=1 Tax=Verticiella alkaliphila TaxID=2779529 RepID=UPI001C0B02DF|nr:thiamine pyrophosphate-binding protein [Verticiella sp. GG226]MBU4609959.1 thiamine pyrophosphate-binding protein [Verticiella sp. GG226]
MTTPALTARPGGRILVDQLIAHGVDQVFCVPGESYLAVLDALHDADITVTVCRQEGGAAMMAEAQGKLTGRPGICFVTRAPGATNASAGVHIAQQDSTPMILFVGQIERGMREREAFQEIDYRAAFGPLAKWATEIDDVTRLPETISRAFHVATSGRPGPVVIALPEDMLVEMASVADVPHYAPVQPAPSAADIAALRERLAHAKAPLAILGGSTWTAESAASFMRFAQAAALPVAVSFRRQMLCPASHPNFVGDLGLGANPQLLQAVREADLILMVGGRFSEVPSQAYTLLDVPVPRQALVHVHPDPEELNRVYRATQAINAGAAPFVQALAGVDAQALAMPGRQDRVQALHASYLAWSDTARIASPGRLNMAGVMGWLNENLPADAVLCNGAGNYATWLHRFYRFPQYGTQLAPTSGSMGYGVPAAIGAQRLDPNRTVVAFAGDGCFLMHGQEFATAVQYDLPIIVVVVDNGMLGTIRMHQERHYPGRVSATDLRNPDFVAYAQAFGGYGERVETTDAFGPAFTRARASGRPAILHCLLDAEALTPAASLSQIRDQALRAKG